MNRKLAREYAMKILYQMEINNEFNFNNLHLDIFDEYAIEIAKDEYLLNIINNIKENLAEIDEQIIKHSKSWKIDRFPKVDLSILRLSMYEIKHMSDIPFGVSINEAIEVAKKYSTEDSSKFINGLLGGYIRSKE